MNKEKLENIKNSILEEKLCAALTNITSDHLLTNPKIAASLKNYRHDKEIATNLEHYHSKNFLSCKKRNGNRGAHCLPARKIC